MGIASSTCLKRLLEICMHFHVVIYIYLAKVVFRLVHISNIETPGNIVWSYTDSRTYNLFFCGNDKYVDVVRVWYPVCLKNKSLLSCTFVPDLAT